ncbi:MAG: hypothetical protein CMJ46_08755 [Planctomyces sp.]|nr:hypothetical protein [Planctomyces sp.]
MRRYFGIFLMLFSLCLGWPNFTQAATPDDTAPVPDHIESEATEADCTCFDSESEQSPDYVNVFPTPEAAAAFLSPDLQTGSLIFTKGDCLAVRMFTRSPYTHVAAVVKEKGGLYIYDSMNPMGVRRLSLTKYLSTQQPDELHLLHPRVAWTQPQQEAFVAALESRMGTPYSVKHHLTGRRSDGIHCAEYVIDALAECDVMRAKNPPRVSPASLLQGGVESDRYQPVRSFAIHPPEVPTEVADGWCEQMWIDTCDCTSNCWTRFRKMVFCY